MSSKKVWLVFVQIPKELLDDIKQGFIDLAGSTIDLEDLADAYDDDLDKEGLDQDEDQANIDAQTEQPAAAPAVPLA
jgi:hypothetical protein